MFKKTINSNLIMRNPVKTRIDSKASRIHRLKRTREILVSHKKMPEVLKNFAHQFELLHNHPLKNWRIECKLPEKISENSVWTNVELTYDGEKIANATICARIANKKLELEIYEVQGTLNSKEQHAGFKKEHNILWNKTLIQAIVDSAYWADFDRVKLRDITTTLSYKNPTVLTSEIQKVKRRMREQNIKAKTDCNFTKEEWKGPAHYWIREFP